MDPVMQELAQESMDPQMLAFVGSFMGVLILLSLVDVGLKGWGMWRAAKMNKKGWFIALLLVNSLGILPGIFLLITKEEYAKTR